MTGIVVKSQNFFKINLHFFFFIKIKSTKFVYLSRQNVELSEKLFIHFFFTHFNILFLSVFYATRKLAVPTYFFFFYDKR